MDKELTILQQALKQGLDPHTLKAAHMYKVPYEEVTKEQRQAAKVINFQELYTPKKEQ